MSASSATTMASPMLVRPFGGATLDGGMRSGIGNMLGPWGCGPNPGPRPIGEGPKPMGCPAGGRAKPDCGKPGAGNAPGGGG